MHPLLLALACAVLGMASAVLSASLGVGAAVITLVLAVPLALRGDRLAAVSGLLIGFGGMWLLILASQAASGGHLSDPARWIVVGAAPLAIGSVALVARLTRTLGPASGIRRR